MTVSAGKPIADCFVRRWSRLTCRACEPESIYACLWALTGSRLRLNGNSSSESVTSRVEGRRRRKSCSTRRSSNAQLVAQFTIYFIYSDPLFPKTSP